MKFRAEVELGGKTETSITVPDDVVAALDAGKRPPVVVTVGGGFFDGLAHTHRKEWARWVDDAKREATRASRVAQTLASLHAGKRTR